MYEKAIVEVLEVIDHMEPDVTRKIPPEVIKALIQRMDAKYNFVYDESKNLSEQNLSADAQTLLATIFIKYLATPEEKKQFKELINKTANFNLNKNIPSESTINISKDNLQVTTDVALVKPEKWYHKLFNKILSFFRHRVRHRGHFLMSLWGRFLKGHLCPFRTTS